VTIDERTSNKVLDGAMGDDHPVIWAKTVGKGRVVQNSMGHSWTFNNVYTANNEYLTKLLYGMLGYAAGGFLGCTDKGFEEFNPDATKNDPEACITPVVARVELKKRW
jgi:type 1 glutamine amidotransferase